VTLQDVDDLQSGAALGVEHAARHDDGLGGVTAVDRVGEVPLRDVAGVAEVRLDVREVERRRAVDRLQRPRERVDAGHVVAQWSVILTPCRDRRSRGTRPAWPRRT
jgi:hypothetical protein